MQNNNNNAIQLIVAMPNESKRSKIVEAAVDRTLRSLPKPPTTEATCFICLEGGDVIRGCGCRGPHAGFAHVACLAELATKRDDDKPGFSKHWIQCSLCHRAFGGRLKLELHRQLWRQSRSAPAAKRNAATALLSAALREHGTVCDYLDNVSTLPFDHPTILMDRANHAARLTDDGRHSDALTILQDVIAIARKGRQNPIFCYAGRITVTTLIALDRVDDALKLAKLILALDQRFFGPDSDRALHSMLIYANALLGAKRFSEAKLVLADLSSIQSRVLGHDHPEAKQVSMILQLLNHGAGASSRSDDDGSLAKFLARCQPPGACSPVVSSSDDGVAEPQSQAFLRLFAHYSSLPSSA